MLDNRLTIQNNYRLGVQSGKRLQIPWKIEWTPAYATTIGWYDASDTSTITSSGGAVSQLDDKSGNSRHLTQSTGTRQPTTGTRSLNSLNVLDFDGGDWLDRSSFPIPSSGDIFISMVAVVDSVNNEYRALMCVDAATNDMQFDAGNNARFDGRISVLGLGSNCSLTGGPFPGPSVYHLNFDYTGIGSYNAYVDGTQRGANTTYSTKLNTSQIFRIGANRLGNFPIDGAIAEVVLMEDCSSTCRQILEGYFAHKWGLTANLPSGHPYETNPPYV